MGAVLTTAPARGLHFCLHCTDGETEACLTQVPGQREAEGDLSPAVAGGPTCAPGHSCPGCKLSDGTKEGSPDPAGSWGLCSSWNHEAGCWAQAGTQLSPGRSWPKDSLSICREPDPSLGVVGTGQVGSVFQTHPILNAVVQEGIY